MYLSRVKLNPRRRGAANLTSNPRAMHAAVESSFPSGPGGRTLWRLDRPDEHSVHLLVVSPARPDLTHVVEQAGWPDSAPYEVRDYNPFLAGLANGQRVRFGLTANPSHRSHQGPNGPLPGRGRTYGHVTVDQQTRWFMDRTERIGLTVDPARFMVTGREQLAFRHDSGQVMLTSVTFTGQAEVADRDKLVEALVSGVGRGKAYGLGMLSVAPD